MFAMLAETAQAAPRSELRAGSYFSETADYSPPTNRRPNRRNSRSIRQPAESYDSGYDNADYDDSGFDYRLGADEADDYSSYDQADLEFEEDYVAQTTYRSTDRSARRSSSACDCVGTCCCDGSVEAGCGCDDVFEPSCGCDDVGCGSFGAGCFSSCRSKWHLGVEFSFIKPRFSENVAFYTMESTGAGNSDSVFTDTEFEYDLEFTPRVWIEAPVNGNWSWRVTYWQFDYDPGDVSTSPAANGFGEITHPGFRDVDISTTIPTDVFSASSTLNVFTIDAETIKQARLGAWQLGVGGGVRYASTEQTYSALLEAQNNIPQGTINYSHDFEGVGPMISLAAKRPLFREVQLACSARGSLLFGDSSSRLLANEDINLTNPFSTTQTTNRDDLLPVGEARIGVEWLSSKRRRNWQWLLTSSMEGQIWGNAGNATSETGDLGFFGFNVGIGWLR